MGKSSSTKPKKPIRTMSRDHVRSPDWAWHIAAELLGIEVGMFYDPTPYKHHKLGKAVNGLKQNWRRWNFCNPPYSQLELWVERAIEQWHQNGCETILFVPHRSHSHWFHDYVFHHFEVIPIRSEVQFKGFSNTLPMSMCFIHIGPYQRNRVRSVNNPLYVLTRQLNGTARATWKKVTEQQVHAEVVESHQPC